MTDVAARPPQPPSKHSRSASTNALLALICLAILVTFGRLLAADFTWWDDAGTIHQNPLFNPPTFETLRHYWTRPEFGLYVPVTDTVWAALAKLAYVGRPDEFNVSLNPSLFHAANLGLHLASSALVFRLLRRLLGAPVPACLGALLFALHPLQVETVAWISGMKDMLCWTGTLGAIVLYVRRVQTLPAAGVRLWASWEVPAASVLFAVAILCKPTAIVAPAAMLAIDGLVLRRRWLASLIELPPLFAIALAGAIVARAAQVVGGREQVPLWTRPFVVGDAMSFYLAKFAWPFSLGIDYGRTPTLVIADPWTYVRWLLPASLTGVLIVKRRRLPWLALAGALAAIGVAPVSGIATFQMQDLSTTADHYVYFSMLGPAVALAWALRRWPARSLRVGVALLLVGLAARSFDQCRHWRDTFALFEQALRVNPNSMAAENNLASVELRRQVPRLDLAEAHARRAIALRPDDLNALQGIGIIEGRLGHAREAAAAFDRLWMLCHLYNAGATLEAEIARDALASMLDAGDPKAAVVWARRAVALRPDDYQARADLAYAMKMVEKRSATTRPPTTVTR